MAYRYTRSKAKMSRSEDRAALKESQERKEKEFCDKLDKLAPGATRKTFESAFGISNFEAADLEDPSFFWKHMWGLHLIDSKKEEDIDLARQMLTDALQKEEEEKMKKQKLKDELKIWRRKRRRVLEEELAALEKKDEEDESRGKGPGGCYQSKYCILRNCHPVLTHISLWMS